MSSITIIRARVTHHQNTHADAINKGFLAHGIKSYMQVGTHSPVKTKQVACWGWRTGKILKDKGHEVLVMERGYIGDRFKYTSLGWNGLNGHAEFPEYECDGGERFKSQGGKIIPWKDGGNFGLILGQVPGDQSLKGMDMMPWYEQKAKEIKERHGINVIFRPHPDLEKKNIKQTVIGCAQPKNTLQEALSASRFAVCYNSNSSVDSVLAGVPCVVGDRGSMAYDVCGKEIGEIIKPAREKWAYSLAFKQWSLDEISSGKALEKIACRILQ